MSDQSQGNFAPPPSSQEKASFPYGEEAKDLEGSNTGLHPLEPDTVAKAEEFEAKRERELAEERAEHMRMRSGGDVNES